MTWVKTSSTTSLFVEEDCHVPPWVADRPAIVLIHGLAECTRAWAQWIPYLADAFRVLRIDLPGFGRSTVDIDAYPWSIASFADDVNRALDLLGVDRAHIVGAKVGGSVALQFATRYPGRTIDVVSLTGPLWAVGNGRLVHQSGIGDRVQAEGVYAWAEATMTDRLGTSVTPAQRQWWINMMATTDVRVLARGSAGASTLDLRPALTGLKLPALMITTAKSPLSTPEMQATWAELIPHAGSIVLPYDGYHVAAIDPRACAQAIRAFFEGQDPAAAIGL